MIVGMRPAKRYPAANYSVEWKCTEHTNKYTAAPPNDMIGAVFVAAFSGGHVRLAQSIVKSLAFSGGRGRLASFMKIDVVQQ